MPAAGIRAGHRAGLRPAGRLRGGRAGLPYPDETRRQARAADAILFGAVGGPQWEQAGAAVAPGTRPAGDSRRSGTIRQPAPGDSLSAVGGGVVAQAGTGRRIWIC
jgi:hypothetical protein